MFLEDRYSEKCAYFFCCAETAQSSYISVFTKILVQIVKLCKDLNDFLTSVLINVYTYALYIYFRRLNLMGVMKLNRPLGTLVSKTLHKKTVQENVDDDRFTKQYFPRAYTVERRE
jgi:hypothetical protein